jgi:hypothetical protein
MAGAKSAASEYLEKSKKINAGNPNTAKINESPSPFLSQVKKGIDWTTSTVGGVVQKSKDLRNTARNDQGSYPKIQQRVGDYFGGTGDATLGDEKKKLDQTLRQNTFKPSVLSPNKPSPSAPGNGTTNTVPSKLIGAQQEAGTSRFDKSKLTLGNNPYTGQVGMFKDGQMQEPGSVRLSGGNLGGTPLPAGQSPFFMKSQAAQGLVPQPGTASAIPGMQQNPAVTMPGGNMTGLMNQETAMLSTALGQNMKPGQYQDFSKSIGMNPNTPGGDGAFRNIESQISMLNNQNSQLMGGYGQSVEMGNMSKTKRLAMVQANNEQIKGLSDSLTGRSTLANDLVKALLAAQTGKETTAMTANAGTEQERIKAAATLGAAQYEAVGRSGDAALKREQEGQYKQSNFDLNKLKAVQTSLQKQYDANQDPAIKSKLDEVNSAIEMLGTGSDDYLQKMIERLNTTN